MIVVWLTPAAVAPIASKVHQSDPASYEVERKQVSFASIEIGVCVCVSGQAGVRCKRSQQCLREDGVFSAIRRVIDDCVIGEY